MPHAALGEGALQQVLLGEPCGDTSPMLLGITTLMAGRTSALIEHDTAEVAYVIAGSGWMVGEVMDQAFAAGDAILIDARCWHAIRAGVEGAQMLYVFPTAGVPPTRVAEQLSAAPSGDIRGVPDADTATGDGGVSPD